jgi:hypothetical protein
MCGFSLSPIHNNFLCQIYDQQLKNVWYLMAMKPTNICALNHSFEIHQCLDLFNEHDNNSGKYNHCCCMLQESITISMNLSF